jgi:hypothetical protein
VIAQVIIVLDEGGEMGSEITGQIIVLQQDAVFEDLVPALDLALGLGKEIDRRMSGKILSDDDSRTPDSFLISTPLRLR